MNLIRQAADIATRLLWYTRMLEVARRLLASRGRFVLVFHGVAGRRYKDIPHAVQPWHTAAEFQQTLRWLATRFSFLTPEEFFRGDQSGVLLTFDDGLANNVTHALPVLEEFEAPAVFFVSTQHVIAPRNWLPQKRRQARRHWAREENVPEEIAVEFFDGMSVDQLVDCGIHPLITIGAHTVSHPLLTQCDDQQLTYELIETRKFLRAVTGQPVATMAYPTGDYDRRVATAVRDAGYQAAFAVDSRRVGMPLFEIERLGLYEAHPAYLAAKLSGLYRRPIREPLLPEQHKIGHGSG
ncbi:MAG: polysaccharide deacetylase family protein [Chloroflexi bacterium]|nr:polysaccharide deacetylase family protein [Chloroflexota bacterium]MCI0579656.1 polysaccharide deacetylase family protein [Chloroflexota bacterium]MCI0645904.1 polysaccharide deacetylase family protein [Chloroflexota bacterium]MCI0725759.1 polysaccharide deacetylase family protein [Chloroflexota bacterium]